MITYLKVDSTHDICREQCPDYLPVDMKKFWNSRKLDSADGAILALDGDKIIGFFRYFFPDWIPKSRRKKCCHAIGTYVMTDYRRMGVGKSLWEIAIKKLKPHVIDVVLTSMGSVKLVKSLREKYEKIYFVTEEYFG